MYSATIDSYRDGRFVTSFDQMYTPKAAAKIKSITRNWDEKTTKDLQLVRHTEDHDLFSKF